MGAYGWRFDPRDDRLPGDAVPCECLCHSGEEYEVLVWGPTFFIIERPGYWKLYTRPDWDCPHGCIAEEWDGKEAGCWLVDDEPYQLDYQPDDWEIKEARGCQKYHEEKEEGRQ